jgi:hypothetical protein
MDERSTAFQAGEAAARAGQPASANPHPPGPLHDAWHAGYLLELDRAAPR